MQQSLQIITEMIGNAKQNLAKDGSFYFLLWGMVVAFATNKEPIRQMSKNPLNMP